MVINDCDDGYVVVLVNSGGGGGDDDGGGNGAVCLSDAPSAQNYIGTVDGEQEIRCQETQ